MTDSTSASVTVDRGPFEMVPHWLLDEDVSAQAIRLYLLMRRHGNRDGTAFPGRRRLAEQMGASASTVDRAKADLIRVGALCETRRLSAEGDWTSNLYHVHWERLLDCRRLAGNTKGSPVGDDTSPAYGDTSPADDDTGPPRVMNELIPTRNLDPLTHTGADVDTSTQAAVIETPMLTEGQLVNTITRQYTDRVPLSNFPAVAGIVRKAIRAHRYQPQEIVDALLRMADEGRPVTTDSLRIELEGLPELRRRPSGARIYAELAAEGFGSMETTSPAFDWFGEFGAAR